MAPKKKPTKQTKASKPVSKPAKKVSKPVSSGKGSSSKSKKRAAPKKRAAYPKSLYLYNKLNKEFAAYNRTLPKEEQIPYAYRRKIIKDKLLPYFMALSKRGATNKAILDRINFLLSEFDANTCDPREVDKVSTENIPYYAIDKFIDEDLPDCLDMRVNGGEYGKTEIFNTSDYEYSDSGVMTIVENIRAEYGNDSTTAPVFNGEVLVKPNRPDNGRKENYFLDMQLYTNGEPVELPEEDTRYVSSKKKSKQEKEKAARLKARKKEINDKISKLTKKTSLGKRKTEFVEEKEKKPKQTKQAEAQLLNSINTYIANMQNLYKQGLISKKDMKAAMQKAINLQVPSAAPVAPKKVAKKIPLGKKPAAAKAKKSAPMAIPPQANRFLQYNQPKKSTRKRKK